MSGQTVENLNFKKSESPPRWDLTDLYSDPKGQDLERDLRKVEAKAKLFHENYFGKVSSLNGDRLCNAIVEYESIDESLSKIMSFAQLVHSENVTDPEKSIFYQTIQERITAISAYLVFFTLELNGISDLALKRKLKSEELQNYQSWLRDLRAFRPHQLGEDMERMLHDKHVAGRAAWTRLFDETMGRLRLRVGRDQKTVEETLHMLSDRDSKVRKAGARALGKGLQDNVHLFTLITNTLAKDKEIEDRWRGHALPQQSRNLSNQVEDEVVDALSDAVHKSYAELSHRYYGLKANWFGKRRLDYWDRNAPLPEAGETYYSWGEARQIVLSAYRKFSPELEALGERFFNNGWIDAECRAGKASGAFAHPTVPSAHPYLLLNYMGRPRDVMTLAHELGHGVHQILAAQQGHLKCDTPLTLAETASVFGEMLTFRSVLDLEQNGHRRKTLLAGKVEDMLNTLVRQIAFYDFELRVHKERREGELSADRICELWLAVQSESLGPSIRLHDEYKYYWCYIPHFVHSPFYVYAYAFGDCLVNALYARYLESGSSFVEKYLSMLRAGGTLRHKDLLEPFGLDATDPDFWSTGLGVVSGLIDDLEELC
ncbi:MAG: M3 family oligoendopeptidase [Rhodospirillaceae bacterium]